MISFMPRPSGPKTRNSGTMTEAKFTDYIKNVLRKASQAWKPIGDVKKEARVRRGKYLCAGCKKQVDPTYKDGRKRKAYIFVDHIDPVIDPKVGFQGFDSFVNRLFCEKDNLQLLCKPCHDEKSNKERAIAAERRANERV